jgi:serine/alanine adding enzyme
MNIIILNREEDTAIFRSWDRFVNQHPDGSIFQTSHYYRIFSKSELHRPLAVIILDEKEEIKGVLTGIIHYQFKGPLKYFSSRCVIFGGPLAENNNPEIVDLLLGSYNKYISSRVIYSQFRNLFDCSQFIGIFIKNGYYHEEHLNILIDLQKSEEQLWKELHTKRRNEIRKAEKEGLEFMIIENLSEFEKSYEILKSLYARIKLPIHKKDIFLNVFQSLLPHGYSTFFGAYFNGELVGTMVAFSYKGTMYNWYAGSNADFYKKYPNDFLPWKIFLWAKENGFKIFDWGGAGKPNVPYGVRDYKEKFGGQFVNYGRFERIHNKFIFFLAKKAFILWQKIK